MGREGEGENDWNAHIQLWAEAIIRNHLRKRRKIATSAGALRFVQKPKEWQEEAATERLELLALRKNSSGKLANFSPSTRTSLLGTHERLDYKVLADSFTCKQENICVAEMSIMDPQV